MTENQPYDSSEEAQRPLPVQPVSPPEALPSPPETVEVTLQGQPQSPSLTDLKTTLDKKNIGSLLDVGRGWLRIYVSEKIGTRAFDAFKSIDPREIIKATGSAIAEVIRACREPVSRNKKRKRKPKNK